MVTPEERCDKHNQLYDYGDCWVCHLEAENERLRLELQGWQEEWLEHGNKHLRAALQRAEAALNQHGHVVEFRDDGWAIEHAIECRQRSLLDCPFNTACEALDGPPTARGRFEVDLDEEGNLIVGRPVLARGEEASGE